MFILELSFYLDDAVRAHRSAECASNAGLLIGDLSGMVSLLIDLIGRKAKELLGTYVNAQAAALAVIGVKCKLCHRISTFPRVLFMCLYKEFLYLQREEVLYLPFKRRSDALADRRHNDGKARKP